MIKLMIVLLNVDLQEMASKMHFDADINFEFSSGALIGILGNLFDEQ